MPESQIILQMIAIVLLVWVPVAGGLVFLIWAVKKTIWHGMTKTKSNGMTKAETNGVTSAESNGVTSTESNRMTSIKSKGILLAVYIGAAIGGVLPVLLAVISDATAPASPTADGVLRVGPSFDVWRIIGASLFGAFSCGLIALFVGSIASALRTIRSS
ncbi:MAG: hypothetical protein SFV81_27040 [Pirellulaceae bacterium]|nr:hypothetical protein [Pirellulaceae bacterium]